VNLSTRALAIQGGTPVRAKPWPRWPMWDQAEERAVLEALRGGEWGGFPMPNRHAGRFAEAFARYHDCEHGLCVANGTVSIEVAIQAAGVEPGAEVVVPAYTFEATAAAVLFAGCVPVLADVTAGSYCLDPASLEASIGPRTQAVIPVHLGMRFADLDAIGALAERHGLAVIEDCAHAHGGQWRGRGAGSWGIAGSFSFQTSKLMTAGEGGIVITRDSRVLDRLFALANCGRQRPGRAADTPVIGHNYRMTDFQAAILEVQLGRLAEQHERRNANVARLESALEAVEGLEPLARDPRVTRQAAYQVVLRYSAARFGDLPRAAFVAALEAEGVPCDAHFYDALTRSSLLVLDERRYPAWAKRSAESRVAWCPNAERAAYEEAVWLPHQLFLGDGADVDQIVEAIAKVRLHAGELHGFEHPAIERHRQPRTRRE
jgi:dTDP-4-amino-4,6-dideoxygalactose transaminase